MKINVYLFFLLLLAMLFSISCRKDKEIETIQTESFIKFYGSSTIYNEKVDVKSTGDGGYILVGTAEFIDDNGASHYNIFAVKTDNFGNEVWSYEDMREGTASNLEINSDGNYIIIGESESAMYALLLGKNGNEIKHEMYKSGSSSFGLCGIQTNDGGYIFAGQKDYNDFYYVKVSADLTKEKEGGTVLAAHSKITSIVNGLSGDYLITGYQSVLKYTDPNVFKLNEEANSLSIEPFQWTWKDVDTINNYGAEKMIKLSNNEYLVVGNNQSFSDFYTMKFKILQDQNSYDSIVKDYFIEYKSIGSFFCKSVCKTSDEGFAVIGSINSDSGDNLDLCLIRFGKLGNVLWKKKYGGLSNDYGSSIVYTPDGGFAIAGISELIDNSKIILIKTDSEGELLAR